MPNLRRPAERYTSIAVALHWIIALGIFAMIAIGLTMAHARIAPAMRFGLYQLHKSVGITILGLVLARLAWRLTHRPPALPDGMPPLEKHAAEGTHLLLYGLMLGMPLVGWALVSASPLNIPTYLYGVIRWPHLPILSTLHDKAPVEAVLKQIHAYGAYILIAVVGLHAAAALRHHVVLGDDILRRMIPGLPRFRAAQPKRSA